MRLKNPPKWSKILFCEWMNVATKNTNANLKSIMPDIISHVREENPKGWRYSYVKMNRRMDSWECAFAGGHALKQDTHETLKDWLVREMGVLDEGGVFQPVQLHVSFFHRSLQAYSEQLGPSTKRHAGRWRHDPDRLASIPPRQVRLLGSSNKDPYLHTRSTNKLESKSLAWASRYRGDELLENDRVEPS